MEDTRVSNILWVSVACLAWDWRGHHQPPAQVAAAANPACACMLGGGTAGTPGSPRACRRPTKRRPSWLSWRPRPPSLRASYTHAHAARPSRHTTACSETPATTQRRATSQSRTTCSPACKSVQHRCAQLLHGQDGASSCVLARGGMQQTLLPTALALSRQMQQPQRATKLVILLLYMYASHMCTHLQQLTV